MDRFWLRAATAALCVLVVAPCSGQGSYAPDSEGWMPLFNGSDLTGWHLRWEGGPNGWSAEDGVLVNRAPSTDLVSDVPLWDHELHIEFRTPPGGNSGVYIHGRYEIQIADSPGAEPNWGTCGSVYGKLVASTNACLPAGEWQTYDVTFRGPRFDRDGNLVQPQHIRLVFNGTEVLNDEFEGITGGAVDDRVGEPGRLMLQGDHGPIEYRNIRYRPVRFDWAPEDQFTAVFDGTSLDGWRVFPTGHGSGGSWTVADGAICGTQDTPGNGGVLMTEGTYGDYEIRCEINPDWGIDSGLFLRSTDDGRCYQSRVDYRPGGEVGTIYGEGIGGMNISNPAWSFFYKPEDWNELRVLIEGTVPRIQVWLNGNLISDWTDTEERLSAAGRIGLQVHGGGDWEGRMTRFRNIRIRPL